MIIGLLGETAGDQRVALTPENVAALKKLNIDKVLVESGAGKAAFFNDEDYEAKGATIGSREEVLAQGEIFLTVTAPPTSDIGKMAEGSILIGGLNPWTNTAQVQEAQAKKVSSFSLDAIPRTTRAQAMDILSSMATVTGYKAVLVAAAHLPSFFPMFMTAAGTIAPSKVLVLGAGVAGLQAIATARRLGAVVEAFDVRAAAREEVLSLGAKFVDVEGAQDDKGAGGYAVAQTEEFQKKQAAKIHEHAAKSDVVICSAQVLGRIAPILLKADTVRAMKPGSVVVDLAVNNGGNCELSEPEKTVVHNGVSIIGTSLLPSTMPLDASKMLGKNMVNFLKLITDKEGNLNLNFEDDLVEGTCITHGGEVKNETVAKALSA